MSTRPPQPIFNNTTPIPRAHAQEYRDTLRDSLDNVSILGMNAQPLTQTLQELHCLLTKTSLLARTLSEADPNTSMLEKKLASEMWQNLTDADHAFQRVVYCANSVGQHLKHLRDNIETLLEDLQAFSKYHQSDQTIGQAHSQGHGL